MGPGTLNRSYALVVGLWLATLQVNLFFALQTYLSSSVLSWTLLVGCWLMGSILGVRWLRPGDSPKLISLAFAGALLCQFLLLNYPYRLSLLPLHALLLVAVGLYPGYFFQAERSHFTRPGQLFFWETLGFVLGLLISVPALMRWGLRAFTLSPYGGLVVLAMWALRSAYTSSSEDCSHAL